MKSILCIDMLACYIFLHRKRLSLIFNLYEVCEYVMSMTVVDLSVNCFRFDITYIKLFYIR